MKKENLYGNAAYRDMLSKAAGLELPWEKLKGRSVVIAGATGLIGRCVIDLLMHKNQEEGLACRVYAISRDERSARERLKENYFESDLFRFIRHDIRQPFRPTGISDVDYVMHLASKTHPRAYVEKPVETIITNISGTQNLLEFGAEHHASRIVFLSSVEIYGENRGDVERFSEDYLGYLDSNTIRAGYPESKRCGEALCQAYMAEKGLDIVISRLPRVYGPTMLEDDSKAAAQFIRRAACKQDIILKSEGSQQYSFLHVIDAVSGILTVMLAGKKGEAYNVAGSGNDITLKNLAEMIAGAAGTSLIYDLPDEAEQRGYSTATKAMLDGQKISGLGWKPLFTVEEGIRSTLDILTGNQGEVSFSGGLCKTAEVGAG